MDGRQLGVAAAGQQRHRAIADAPAVDLAAPTAATSPAHSRPRISEAPGGGG